MPLKRVTRRQNLHISSVYFGERDPYLRELKRSPEQEVRVERRRLVEKMHVLVVGVADIAAYLIINNQTIHPFSRAHPTHRSGLPACHSCRAAIQKGRNNAPVGRSSDSRDTHLFIYLSSRTHPYSTHITYSPGVSSLAPAKVNELTAAAAADTHTGAFINREKQREALIGMDFIGSLELFMRIVLVQKDGMGRMDGWCTMPLHTHNKKVSVSKPQGHTELLLGRQGWTD
jgi:hypothetical protein